MSTATAVRTTQQVADRLVALCRQGKFVDAIQELYAPNITSTEPEGGPGPAFVKGFDAVLDKSVQFGNGIEEVFSNTISDPVVAENFFSVAMSMDLSMKGMGRLKMEEIAVYQVRDGKIISDHFFYTPMPAPGKN